MFQKRKHIHNLRKPIHTAIWLRTLPVVNDLEAEGDDSTDLKAVISRGHDRESLKNLYR